MLRTLVLLALLGWGVVAQGEEIIPAEEGFFQETFGDFSEELEIAREEGLDGIFIFFEMDECPFCHRMKQTILNRKSVQDYYREHFRLLRVDIEGDIEITDFDGEVMKMKDFAFKKHRVRATPVLGFFDLEGERVVRHIGPVNSVEDFLLLGEFVVNKHYKDTSFTRFKRSRN